MKRTILIITLLINLIFLIGCEKELKRQRTVISAMNTTISVDFYGGSEEDLKEIIDIYAKYSQISSNFRRHEVDSDSPYYNWTNVYLINEKRGIEAVEVSDELFELIEYSLWLIDDTNGYFNPLMGNAIDIWKEVITAFKKVEISEEVYNETLASLENLTKASELKEKIVLNKDNKSVYLKDKSVLLDLGAVAKGYATNLATNYLIEQGIKYYMIDAGSSNIAIGTHIEKRAYRIGNKDPKKVYQDGLIGVVEKKDTHIVTSGYDEQYATYQEHYYHHIVNPFSYLPNDHFLSVILLGDDASLLDAYSTAVYSMSKEEAEAFLNEKGIGYVLYIKENLEVVSNLSSDIYTIYEKK
ncbi:MAG: FAD:protein FMN transferase [Acholeplasmataceae bacterium]|nr:FAD:protein FMN transferase [Acholeplasmataceae bacterium]